MAFLDPLYQLGGMIPNALNELGSRARAARSGGVAGPMLIPESDTARYRMAHGGDRFNINDDPMPQGHSAGSYSGQQLLEASLDSVTPFPIGALTYAKARAAVPGLHDRVGKYLSDDEKALFEYPNYKSLGERTLASHKNLPAASELQAVAQMGGAKRGWYADSVSAIDRVFANAKSPDDPERFTALLAAMSPQTSVQSNLKNALNTWVRWDAAGRPKDMRAIDSVMEQAVERSQKAIDEGGSSVLPGWRNNSMRALMAADARNLLGQAGLSGPKVQSFFSNLRGVYDEVTNDAWMSKLSSVDQAIYGGKTRTGKSSQYVDDIGALGIKGPGYLAQNALTRNVANRLDWAPAEVQETSWSWAKTLKELGEKPEAVRKTMQEFGVPIPPAIRGLEPSSAEMVLRGGLLSDEAIASAPAFGDMFQAQPYKGILDMGGLDTGNVVQLPHRGLLNPYDRIGASPDDLGRTPEGKHVIRAARRLDASTRRSEAESAIDSALGYQRAASSATDKKKAAQALGAARRMLKRSAKELPNMGFEPEYRIHLQ